MKYHALRNNVVSSEANSSPDPLPRSSCLHFNTTLHRCYTHVSDRLLRSILKRKCNHLSIEQALEWDGEGEKTHTHSYVNMLQREERSLWMLEAETWGCIGGSGEWGSGACTSNCRGAKNVRGDISRYTSCLGSVSSHGILCVYVRMEEQNRLLISGQRAVRWWRPCLPLYCVHHTA